MFRKAKRKERYLFVPSCQFRGEFLAQELCITPGQDDLQPPPLQKTNEIFPIWNILNLVKHVKYSMPINVIQYREHFFIIRDVSQCHGIKINIRKISELRRLMYKKMRLSGAAWPDHDLYQVVIPGDRIHFALNVFFLQNVCQFMIFLGAY